jgi:hypothetical protein
VEKLGHNDEKQVKSLKEFLLPSINELSLYFVISFVILFFINIGLIWSLLNNYSGLNVTETTQAISVQFNNFYEEYFASKFLARVAVFVFWGMVGSITYMLVWAIWHFILRIKEDADESEYEHSDKSTFWQTRLSQHILIFFSSVAGVLYFLIAFYLYPLIFTLSKLTLYNLDKPEYYLYILTGLTISVIYIYVFSRLWLFLKYVYGIYFAGLDD